MVLDILYKKKSGIPYLSLVLTISCILVSVPTYFHPELYDVFGGEKPIFYPWQVVTHHLQHGSYMGLLPLPLHLICNLIVIMTFGVLSEKVFGVKRFFAVIFASLFTAQLIRLTFDVWGNGSSGIVWAFAPVAFLSVLKIFRKNKTKLLRDFMFYVYIFIFLMVWVFITIANIVNGWFYSNLFHLSATIVGVVLTFIWKEYIAKRVGEILDDDLPQKPMYTLWDKRIIGLNFLIPTFIIIILTLSLSGVLTDHVSTAKIVEIYPYSGPVEVINRADNQIVIKFSKPMKNELYQSSFNFYSNEGRTPLSRDIEWVDDQTLHIKFNREIYQGEKIEILLRGFFDRENRKFHDEVRLEYGV